jgi:hypothetical protein
MRASAVPMRDLFQSCHRLPRTGVLGYSQPVPTGLNWEVVFTQTLKPRTLHSFRNQTVDIPHSPTHRDFQLLPFAQLNRLGKINRRLFLALL